MNKVNVLNYREELDAPKDRFEQLKAKFLDVFESVDGYAELQKVIQKIKQLLQQTKAFYSREKQKKCRLFMPTR